MAVEHYSRTCASLRATNYFKVTEEGRVVAIVSFDDDDEISTVRAYNRAVTLITKLRNNAWNYNPYRLSCYRLQNNQMWFHFNLLKERVWISRKA